MSTAAAPSSSASAASSSPAAADDDEIHARCDADDDESTADGARALGAETLLSTSASGGDVGAYADAAAARRDATLAQAETAEAASEAAAARTQTKEIEAQLVDARAELERVSAEVAAAQTDKEVAASARRGAVSGAEPPRRALHAFEDTPLARVAALSRVAVGTPAPLAFDCPVDIGVTGPVDQAGQAMVDAVLADLQVFFTNSIAESAQRAQPMAA